MGYLHIDNLYKNRTVLLFRDVYTLEKIHGTSTHIQWDGKSILTFFSGGVGHTEFCALFDIPALAERFMLTLPETPAVVYGEGYGGKCQKMGDVYGPNLRFVAFDVKIGDCWLEVPKAHDLCTKLGLDFVDYYRVPTEPEALDAQRDMDSTQARRNGMGEGKIREGIIIRPLVEVRTNNGDRIIAKHKGDAFHERVNQPRVTRDPNDVVVMEQATAIAEEWVTYNRLTHVLDRLRATGLTPSLETTGTVIATMLEDVLREAKGEIVETPAVRKQIARKTAQIFKPYCRLLTEAEAASGG